MKYRAMLIVQVLIVIALGLVWIVLGHGFDEERKRAANRLVTLSNAVSNDLSRIDDLRALNFVLQTNLVATQKQYSNELAAILVRNELAANELAKVETEAKASDDAIAAELSRLDKQIESLETQHHDLDTQCVGLQYSITNLDHQIAGIKMKLTNSTSDHTLLLTEARDLQAKKGALENEFNDANVARMQLRRVKAEIAAARDYERVRHSLYAGFHPKGGERLTHPVVAQPENSNAVWRVEITQDGSVTIITSDSTNPASSR